MRIHPINVRSPSDNFVDEINVFAEYQLDSCFGDGECMRVCPVVDKNLTIAELNESTIGDNPLTANVVQFAYDCIQCGECTIACPGGVQRDILMIKLKHKALLQHGESSRLKNYYKAKGSSGLNPLKPAETHLKKEITIRGFNLFAGAELGKLRKHVDKTKFRQCDTLIYFGCYIFSHTGVQFKTIDLAERLGIDYEVLGGLKSCCGWPQLMGGRLEEAEYLHRHVADIIAKVQPKVVVTGCMECYASLKRMLQIKRMSWKPMTTTQWMLQHADALGLSPSDEQLTFHDSCHCTRKLGLGDPPRQLLQKIAHLQEMHKNRSNALCCGYYNFKSSPDKNEKLYEQKMEMVKQTGTTTLAVECITCQESYEKAGSRHGIKVTDLVALVHKNVFK